LRNKWVWWKVRSLKTAWKAGHLKVTVAATGWFLPRRKRHRNLLRRIIFLNSIAAFEFGCIKRQVSFAQ
jgi:hypothetical protein